MSGNGNAHSHPRTHIRLLILFHVAEMRNTYNKKAKPKLFRTQQNDSYAACRMPQILRGFDGGLGDWSRILLQISLRYNLQSHA